MFKLRHLNVFAIQTNSYLFRFQIKKKKQHLSHGTTHNDLFKKGISITP